MPLGQLPIDLAISGNFSCGSFKPPAGCISDAAVAVGAAIAAGKVVHVLSKVYQQNSNAGVVADNQYCHIVHGASCTVAGLSAAVDTVATGADRTVTVDLERSTAGGAFASILQAPLALNNANVARAPVLAALGVITLTQNDILKWVIAVAGVQANQAIGLICDLTLYESAF